ncbi:MAG: DUF4332 domain-containing protein [Halobacteriota archaeon]|nr:DUF4332 domain-containing protein [Halobacteriota archaeon]
MAYHIDAEKTSLDDLRKRIEGTDLVPSRVTLLDGIETKFKTLEEKGITTLASLHKELKNAKRLEAVSKETGIDAQYLTLLRREIGGYFPKPIALKAFDWLPKEEIAKLEEDGIRNTAALHKATRSKEDSTELEKRTGVDRDILDALAHLADLTRVQWVSPTAARMLLEAGYDSVSKVASADAEVLSDALKRVNEENGFFKGNIGLRDIKRLVRAASYVPS